MTHPVSHQPATTAVPAHPMVRGLSLHGLLRAHCHALDAERAKFIDGPYSLTYSDLDRRTDCLANALIAHGVGPGDRVAMMLLDGIPMIELLIACGKSGAIAVPINWRLSAPEIAAIVARSAPRLLFHSDCFDELLPAGLSCTAFRLISGMDPGYERLIADGPAHFLPAFGGAAPLFMLYTSGTTGTPKACLQSHEGAAALGLAYALRLGLTREDRLLSTSPLFHVGGLGQVFAALASGSGITVSPRGADAASVLHLASDHGCTFGSPHDALVAGLCDAQDKLSLPLRLRRITRGSSMAKESQIRRIQESLGAEVIGGYGQTESLGFVLMLDGATMIAEPDALGLPLGHVEAAILDEQGRSLSGPAVGELGLRGPSVMIGYWGDERASEEALRTGWLRTGDLVRRDERGLFHFAGRSKELVKTGGENVYPREVELVLLAHPAIDDAAIVGVEDARWGEAVKACVVIRPGASIGAGEVVQWCRAHIAGYKRPRYVEFVDVIPRDHLGKIQRPKLRSRPTTADQAVE